MKGEIPDRTEIDMTPNLCDYSSSVLQATNDDRSTQPCHSIVTPQDQEEEGKKEEQINILLESLNLTSMLASMDTDTYTCTMEGAPGATEDDSTSSMPLRYKND
jgi:hypothetical protein